MTLDSSIQPPSCLCLPMISSLSHILTTPLFPLHHVASSPPVHPNNSDLLEPITCTFVSVDSPPSQSSLVFLAHLSYHSRLYIESRCISSSSVNWDIPFTLHRSTSARYLTFTRRTYTYSDASSLSENRRSPTPSCVSLSCLGTLGNFYGIYTCKPVSKQEKHAHFHAYFSRAFNVTLQNIHGIYNTNH